MAKSMTNKERLTKVETNQEHLLKQVDIIVPQIQEMHDIFMAGQGKISNNREEIEELNKILHGNGRLGLVNQISKLEQKWYYFAGMVSIIVIITQILIQTIL